jgi:vanillate O-demethylase ferredoxin subunit
VNDGAGFVTEQLEVRVETVKLETEDIRVYELVHPEGSELPAFTAGAHIDVHLPNGFVRQYSLCNDPRETHRYLLGVLRESNGRGGSSAMHDGVRAGGRVTVTVPRNNFPLVEDARRSLLIAGGIGVTPMLAMLHELEARGADYRLHYCTRSPRMTAFMAQLRTPRFMSRVSFHHDGGDPSKGLDVEGLLADVEDGTHVYCCGPAGLMEAVKTASTHWPSGSIHFEYFSTDAEIDGQANTAFEVELAGSGAVYLVPPDKTILDVLLENGHDVESSCEEGLCGTCIVDVLDGIPDHRDLVLDDEEHESNRSMTVCCSRAKSGRLKLDL